MPDPTAHAADMTSPAIIKPDKMPAFWWVNPWGYALNLKRALHAVHALAVTTGDELRETNIDRSKLQQTKHELHALLGKAKSDHNAFQRQVEVTLINGGAPMAYENSIDLVVWAVDEIKSLKASLSVITEDRDAYIDKVEKLRAELLEAKDNVLSLVAGNEQAEDDMTKAEARIKQLTMFCERAGAERDREKEKVEQITLMCNERDRQINTRDEAITDLYKQVRSLKRKLSKAQKAAGIKPAKKKGGRK